MKWIIDNQVNAERIAEQANWHRATTVIGLQSAGISPRDSGDFAAFLFADHATVRDCEPEEYLTDAQYARLSLV